MKILIISLTKFKILDEEFVKPLKNIFKKYGRVFVKNYREDFDIRNFDLIVLSGTAIKDFEYLNHLYNFKWLKNNDKKVIGICAGAQVISLIFGGKLKEKELIGIYNVKSIFGNFKAYFLITKIPILNENFEILGYVDKDPSIFKVKGKEIYGFTFHPEVYNQDLFSKII